MSHIEQPRIRKQFSTLMLLVLVVFTFGFWLYFANLTKRSIGFFDESIYLTLASSHSNDSSLGGVWSFYTKVLYRLVDGDIVQFRILGAAILYLSSVALGISSTRLITLNKTWSNEFKIMFTLIIGLSGFFFYSIFMFFTPGYQWLTLCGLLISSSALFVALSTQGKSSFMSWIVCGWSILLASAGRPTAGAIFLALLMLHPVTRGELFRFPRNLLALIFGFASGLIVHFSFVANYADTLRTFEVSKMISSADETHSLINLLKVLVYSPVHTFYTLFTSTFGLIAFFVPLIFLSRNRRAIGAMSIRSIVYVLSSLALMLLLVKYGTSLFALDSIVLLWWLLVLVVVTIYLVNDFDGSDSSEIESSSGLFSFRQESIVPITLLVALGAFSFLSNMTKIQLAVASIFYVVLILLFVGRIKSEKLSWLLSFAVSCLIIFSLTLAYAQGEKSHLQSAPTDTQTEKVFIGPKNSILFVDKQRQQEIRQVRSLKDKYDYSRIYLLDTSPKATYLQYELGFRSIASPILVNQKFADWMVGAYSDTLRDAWIVTSDDAPASERIDPIPLVMKLGKRFPADYTLVSTLSGQFCFSPNCTLKVWRPNK